jgi:hypothetical protein
MSHLFKILLGAIVAGIILGLVAYAFIAGLEDLFASGTAHITIGRRGGILSLPALIGAGGAWLSMKTLERWSGLAGSVVIFGISLISGAIGAGLIKVLCDANLQKMDADKSLMLALVVGSSFVGTATWMARMEE